MTVKTARIAIYITKPQHIELLRSVSAQMGSSNLKDGLEHILNCRLAGDVPTALNSVQTHTPTGLQDSEFDSLISFE